MNRATIRLLGIVNVILVILCLLYLPVLVADEWGSIWKYYLRAVILGAGLIIVYILYYQFRRLEQEERWMRARSGGAGCDVIDTATAMSMRSR